MNVQEVLLASLSVISALIIFSLVVGLGWYLVWKLFLSRFKLVQELLGLMNDSPAKTTDTVKTTKTKKLRKD